LVSRQTSSVSSLVGVLVLEDLHAFLHALVVEADALARGLLGGGPGAGFEMALGGLAGLAEQAVVLVEAVQDRARDVESDLGRQQFGKRGGGQVGVMGVDTVVPREGGDPLV
jgi:hypothetical protein